MKEELLKLLKEHLTIELQNHNDYDGKGFKIVVKFDGEKISDDYFITEHDNYY